MDPLNKIKFVDEDGSSVVLDVPMTARGERKEVLPIDKMVEIEEGIEEEVKAVEEKVEEEVKAVEEKVEEEVKAVEEKVEEEVKAAEQKVEKEIKVVEEKVEEEVKAVEEEVNALVNDIKEHGIKEIADSIENIEIKIKPPKGCCVIQ